jgi:hypothetical protein
MRRRANRLLGGGRTYYADSFTDSDGTVLSQHAGSGSVWRYAGSLAVLTEATIQTGRLAATVSVSSHTALHGSRLRRRTGRIALDVTRVAAITNMEAGVLFQSGNTRLTAGSYFEGTYAPAAQVWRFVRNNATVVGANVAQVLTQDQVYRLEVNFRKGRAIMSIDGVSVREIDAVLSQRYGWVGIFTQNNVASAPSVVVDNWQVTR